MTPAEKADAVVNRLTDKLQCDGCGEWFFGHEPHCIVASSMLCGNCFYMDSIEYDEACLGYDETRWNWPSTG